ncbi:MAG: helix-turn-helix transcriptional regulator [Nanobdellota archaeon]
MNQKLLVLLLLSFLIFSSMASGEEYYGDITIEVDKAGITSFEGITNFKNFSNNASEEYTSKDGSRWLLNITTNNIFSDLVYNIKLPKGSVVNYIKAPGFSGFEDSKDHLIIKGATTNSRGNILIQYQIKKIDSSLSREVKTGLIISAGTIVLIGAIIIIRRYNRQRFKHKKKYVFEDKTLTPRQKKIVEYLKLQKGRSTQAKLEKEIGIVKSSLSRNIASLERNNIITKEKTGMTNTIRLVESK